MSDYNNDAWADTEPTTSNRYNAGASYLPAQPAPLTRPDASQVRNLAYPLVEAMPTNGEIDAGALRAMESGEKSTPVQRGIGAAIVLVALLIAGIIAGYILAEVGAPLWMATTVFLACAAVGGWLTYQQVTRYSPTGVELDKSQRYENIRLTEIESNERIALKKLEAYLNVLEKVYGRSDD